MAASPVAITPAPVSLPSYSRRPPLALTPRRLAANRRNAARSTGPRTPNGKARVARNAIKHGFFAGAGRWTERQQRDFAGTFAGLCEEFKPQCAEEEICVATVADSHVRMAALWRYENIAALRYHQQCERELNERIAASDRSEAARLEDRREELRRAGLWKPTIPGPREAMALIRYQGRLDRAIRGAMADLEGFRSLRSAAASHRKVQKQTHYSASPNNGPEARRRASAQRFDGPEPAEERCRSSIDRQKQTHFLQQNRGISVNACGVTDAIGRRGETSSSGVLSAARRTSNTTTQIGENAKTNPLSSMSTGNRHARRRAQALARRRT